MAPPVGEWLAAGPTLYRPVGPGAQGGPGGPGGYVPPGRPASLFSTPAGFAASYPGAPGSAPPGAAAAPPPERSGRNGRWLLVAVVAALIGAGVGAGVTAATDHGNSSGLTVNEGRAVPGAAILSGNVSIPELVQKVLPAVVSIDVVDATEEDEGTGMILSSSGEVVTNNHVIALAEAGGTITVTRSGTTEKEPATLIGADPTDDVALLQIKGASGLPTVTLGTSNKAEVGDAVVAIGNALGLAAGTPTVTQGIVSALGRTVTAGEAGTSATETLTNMIQTDAAINPGNSGGPLIDTAGQVIGMNTAVAGATGAGTDAQNIGFAIPSAKIESLLPELQKGGTVQSGGGALGVTITSLTTQLRQEYGFTPSSGAVILSVLPGSPAQAAGLREGDVIVGIDTTSVTSAESLTTAVEKRKPGTKVKITFYVGDLKQTATATLESQAAEQQQEQSSPTRITTTAGGGSTGTGGLSPFGSLSR